MVKIGFPIRREGSGGVSDPPSAYSHGTLLTPSCPSIVAIAKTLSFPHLMLLEFWKPGRWGKVLPQIGSLIRFESKMTKLTKIEFPSQRF